MEPIVFILMRLFADRSVGARWMRQKVCL